MIFAEPNSKNFNISANYSCYKGIGINTKSLKRVYSFSFLIFTNFEPASEKDSELKTLERNILNPDRLINLEIKKIGEQALFNLS